MKHRLLSTFGAIAALALGISGSASATSVGLPGTSSGFSLWDYFPAATFGATAPGAANTSLFTATLTSTMPPPAQLIPGGPTDNRIYSNVSAFNMTLSGTFNADVEDFTLRMKFTSPGVGTALSYFSATSAEFGGAATPVSLGTVTETAGTFNIIEFTWSNIDKEAGDDFTVNITSAGNGHVSLDAVQAVPEPNVAALILLGAAGMVLRRRRAQKA